MTAPDRPPARRNALLAVLLVAVIAGMGGLVAASVPLYRLFCAATGFGGTTQRAAAAPDEVAGALVTVRFDAQTAPDLGWAFRPLESAVQLHPGEQREVLFRATNHTTETVTGTATFNVTPTKTGIY
jgi:cytochrome c oxidase assembly protein subunit 11